MEATRVENINNLIDDYRYEDEMPDLTTPAPPPAHLENPALALIGQSEAQSEAQNHHLEVSCPFIRVLSANILL